MNARSSGATPSAGVMADTGQAGSHSEQSMHSPGSMTSICATSWMQSTGQTSTQERSVVPMHAEPMT